MVKSHDSSEFNIPEGVHQYEANVSTQHLQQGSYLAEINILNNTGYILTNSSEYIYLISGDITNFTINSTSIEQRGDLELSFDFENFNLSEITAHGKISITDSENNVIDQLQIPETIVPGNNTGQFSYIWYSGNNDPGLYKAELTLLSGSADYGPEDQWFIIKNSYNLSFLPPLSSQGFYNLEYGSTLPIIFTARDYETGDFINDNSVNVSILNITGNILVSFNSTNGVQIDSDNEQYSVDLDTEIYPDLKRGETYIVEVNFEMGNNNKSYMYAFFSIVDLTPPFSILKLYHTADTTWINWTWTIPSDSDFNHAKIYLNGTFITNILAPQYYYNATGLLPDTSYELSTRTVDTSGNINETWVNDTAHTLPLADTMPPIITFTPPTDPSGTTLTTRNWTFINVSLSEPGISWLEWNGINESMAGSGTNWYINKTYLVNGIYTYRVWANDSTGNENVSDIRTIEIDYVTDKLLPIITVTSPVNDTLYTTDSVDLNYTVNEQTVWEGYSLDGASNITLSGNTTLFGLNDSLHILTVYANDTSGNMNSSTVRFAIDTTPPSNIYGLKHTAGLTWINWTWTNPHDSDFNHTKIYLNGTFRTNTSAEFFNATDLTPGTEYTISTRTVDTYGNLNATWENNTAFTFAGDTELPVIESITLDAYTTIANATIHVTVNATDNIGVDSVTADGVPLTQDENNWSGSFKVPITAAPGTYSVAIQTSDAVGNTAESTAIYTVVIPQGGVGIDLIPTDTTVDSGTSVTIMVKVTNTENFDDTFNVELTYDNIPAEYSDYKLDFNWTDWLDHRQRVSIKAKSSTEIPLTITVPAGEAGYKLYSITANSMNWVTAGSNTGGILVNTPAGDTTSPSIESVVLDASTTIANATILITVNATDDVGVVSVTAGGASLTQDGNNWSGILKVPITAAPGTYSVAIQASDAAGNAAGATATYTVVTPQGGVGVDLIPTDTTVDSDTSVTIMVKVTNTENFDDTFNVELTYDNIPDEYSEYKLDFNWADWVDHKQQVSVKAKSSTEIPLTITVPTDGTGYKLYSVTARSMNWITVGGNTGGILIT